MGTSLGGHQDDQELLAKDYLVFTFLKENGSLNTSIGYSRQISHLETGQRSRESKLLDHLNSKFPAGFLKVYRVDFADAKKSAIIHKREGISTSGTTAASPSVSPTAQQSPHFLLSSASAPGAPLWLSGPQFPQVSQKLKCLHFVLCSDC